MRWSGRWSSYAGRGRVWFLRRTVGRARERAYMGLGRGGRGADVGLVSWVDAWCLACRDPWAFSPSLCSTTGPEFT